MTYLFPGLRGTGEGVHPLLELVGDGSHLGPAVRHLRTNRDMSNSIVTDGPNLAGQSHYLRGI